MACKSQTWRYVSRKRLKVPMKFRPVFVLLAALSLLSACETLGLKGKSDPAQFPKTEEDRRKERIGKLSGDEGITLAGPSNKKTEETSPLGVNSFLWRAALDTISFMPFQQVDPFGGVIITDWYEDPGARGERFKMNILIMDKELRADSVKVKIFKQRQVAQGWQDMDVDPALNRQMEDAILTRARELRVKQIGK